LCTICRRASLAQRASYDGSREAQATIEAPLEGFCRDMGPVTAVGGRKGVFAR
jgi:hypothetical protein